MVEPFTDERRIKEFAKRYFGFDDEIDARIATKEDLSQVLQKKKGWSKAEADKKIETAWKEFTR